MPRLRIGIAGAGTAGLAAAAFLTRDGHDVRIYERFDAPRPLGAGLMLQPTGLACLAKLGLDAKAIEHGQTIRGIDGKTLRGARIFDVAYRELAPGLFGVGIHRGALFALLYDEAARLGVPITAATAMRSSRLVAGGRVLVDASGNQHGPFDLVIDGTGQKSPLRGDEVAVRLDRAYPYGALWSIVPLPGDWPHDDRLAQVYDGCHLMIGILPVGRRPGDATPLAAFFWSLRVRDHAAWVAGGLPAWKEHVRAAWPQIEPFVVQIRSADDLTFASYADVVLRQRYAERIVFLGDAGRVTSPQLGQGANLALIDAAVLANCLREQASLPAALSTYTEQRRAHTRFYSLASRWLTPFFQSDSRAAALVRDLAFPIAAKVPYVRREMVRTLCGMKTGLFTHLDPGQWHPRYALGEPAGSSQPE